MAVTTRTGDAGAPDRARPARPATGRGSRPSRRRGGVNVFSHGVPARLGGA